MAHEKLLHPKPDSSGATIIRFNDLAPSWHLPGQEPGMMRWLTSWVAGPEGYVNSNPGYAALSQEISAGLMYLDVGNRQRGLHYHSVTEIYVILKGQVLGWDGNHEEHIAGPMDCIYIPAGVPHGVRCYGTEEVEVVWLHDQIEKKGTTVYYTMEDKITTPQVDEISVIKFNDLEPQWTGPNVKEPGHLHWLINWVGGKEGFTNFNPDHAAVSEHTAMGLLVVLPAQKQVSRSGSSGELYIILRGTTLVDTGNGNVELNRLDALHLPAGKPRTFRNHGNEPVFIFWAHEKPQALSSESLPVHNGTSTS